MSSRTDPKVVVLMGGPSAEREVSLVSGRECAAALREAGYNVTELDAAPTLAVDLTQIAPDVALMRCMGAGAKMAVFRVFWNGCAFPTRILVSGLGPCHGQTAQQRGVRNRGPSHCEKYACRSIKYGEPM